MLRSSSGGGVLPGSRGDRRARRRGAAVWQRHRAVAAAGDHARGVRSAGGYAGSGVGGVAGVRRRGVSGASRFAVGETAARRGSPGWRPKKHLHAGSYRHGRVCPGHPKRRPATTDGRDRPGHDNRDAARTLLYSYNSRRAGQAAAVVAPAGASSARRVGLVPVTMRCSSSGRVARNRTWPADHPGSGSARRGAGGRSRTDRPRRPGRAAAPLPPPASARTVVAAVPPSAQAGCGRGRRSSGTWCNARAGGLVEELGVGLAFEAGGLDAQQQTTGGVGLAHHVGGLGGALQGDCGGFVGQAGVAGMPSRGPGGDVLGGDVGFVGIGGKHRGDLRDDGVVAACEVFGRVGDRRRERGAEGVDELVVTVPGELEGGVGLSGWSMAIA